MEERLTVHKSGAAIYDIVLTDSFDGLGREIGTLQIKERRVCIVTDSTVAGYYLDEVKRILEACCRQVSVFVFPAGEAYKNLDTVRRLYEHLIQNHFDRKDMLAALGGGVAGDLCGFAAATYLRGISFIQIPTTLLAQVDSSIGGKTGVDFDAYKNMVGAFHMPRLVYTNVRTLQTLTEEQFSSGMGEVIKHGLIRDAGYYRWLSEHRSSLLARDPDACIYTILRSVEIKRSVVEEDPTEQGERALLNFGHTLGHAIEKQTDFSMLHGHCVGLGMLAAARISAGRGYLTETQERELGELLQAFHMPVKVSGPNAEDILTATKNDKKMDGGRIRFILLKQIGEAFIDAQVTEEEMREGLNAVLQP